MAKQKTIKQRAEAGETIIDLTAEQAKCDFAAQSVIDLFVVERMPDFILAAVEGVLNRAAEAERVNIWDDEKGLSLPALASLFATTQSLNLDAKQSHTSALAAHLSAVLAHPETPEALFNDIADQLASMSRGVDYHTPEMIERTLAAFASRESRRKGGKR